MKLAADAIQKQKRSRLDIRKYWF